MKIIFSPETAEDFKSLYNYILYMEDSPNRAADTEYRFYLICGYYVFYQYDEETDTVKVDRIIYSRRNIDELL